MYLLLILSVTWILGGCSSDGTNINLDTVFSFENDTFKLGENALDLTPTDYNGIRLVKKKESYFYQLIQPADPGPAAETLTLESLSCLYSFPGSTFESQLDIIGTVDFRDVAFSDLDLLEGFGYLLISLQTEHDSVLFKQQDDGTWSVLLYNEATDTSCNAGCSSCAKNYADYEDACVNGACPQAEFVKEQASIGDLEEFGSLLEQFGKRGWAASPLGSHDGKIKEVFMMDMVSADHPIDSVLKNFSGIFSAMDADVQYYILINHDPKFTSFPLIRKRFASKFHMKESDKSRLVLIEPIDYCVLLEKGMLMELDTTFNCNTDKLFLADYWAQDPISVLATEGGMPVLMYPRQFNTFGDYFAASEISAQTGMLTRTAPFSFNAGNQLAGNGFMVMGADAKALALNSMLGDVEADSLPGFDVLPDIDSLFKLVYGVDHIIWIGDTSLGAPNPAKSTLEFGQHQPVYHLDLFLTLAGTVSKTDDRERVFVGIPEVVNPDQLDYDILEVEAMQSQIRAVVRQLENASFDGRKFLVDSIPLPLVINNYGDSKKVVGSLLSFNNCQIEVMPDKKKLYLPSYHGKARLNHLANEVHGFFEQKGFEVQEVNGHFGRTSALDNASLHCVMKVLSRE